MLACFPSVAAEPEQDDLAQPTRCQVARLFPSKDAVGVCPDTLLRIAFTSEPTIGAGNIQVVDAANGTVVDTIDVTEEVRTQSIGELPNFHYQPIEITGNEVLIRLPNQLLTYGKSYLVKLSPDAFHDGDGTPIDGLRRRSLLAIRDQGSAPHGRKSAAHGCRRREWRFRDRSGRDRLRARGQHIVRDHFCLSRCLSRDRLFP